MAKNIVCLCQQYRLSLQKQNINTLSLQYLQDKDEFYAEAKQKHHLPFQHMCSALQCP
jgi:hypothetical protein